MMPNLFLITNSSYHVRRDFCPCPLIGIANLARLVTVFSRTLCWRACPVDSLIFLVILCCSPVFKTWLPSRFQFVLNYFEETKTESENTSKQHIQIKILAQQRWFFHLSAETFLIIFFSTGGESLVSSLSQCLILTIHLVMKITCFFGSDLAKSVCFQGSGC